MTISPVVEAKCDECSFHQFVPLNQKVVWHECNQGNVKHKLPTLKEINNATRRRRHTN